MTSKEKEKVKRKQWILTCTEQIISKKGITRTTMDEVADRAEISKGALYLHFQSKQELILMISVNGLRVLKQKFSQVLLQEISGKEMLNSFPEILKNYIQDHPHHIESFLFYDWVGLQSDYLPEEGEEEIIQQFEKLAKSLFTYLHRALQVGIQDGSIQSKIESKILAMIIWAELQGLMRMHNQKYAKNRTPIFNVLNLKHEDILETFLDLVTQDTLLTND